MARVHWCLAVSQGRNATPPAIAAAGPLSSGLLRRSTGSAASGRRVGDAAARDSAWTSRRADSLPTVETVAPRRIPPHAVRFRPQAGVKLQFFDEHLSNSCLNHGGLRIAPMHGLVMFPTPQPGMVVTPVEASESDRFYVGATRQRHVCRGYGGCRAPGSIRANS